MQNLFSFGSIYSCKSYKETRDNYIFMLKLSSVHINENEQQKPKKKNASFTFEFFVSYIQANHKLIRAKFNNQ